MLQDKWLLPEFHHPPPLPYPRPLLHICLFFCLLASLKLLPAHLFLLPYLPCLFLLPRLRLTFTSRDIRPKLCVVFVNYMRSLLPPETPPRMPLACNTP